MPKSTEEADINYEIIYEAILRNRGVIASFAVSFFVIGCISAVSTRRTWQGGFQIVLDSQ